MREQIADIVASIDPYDALEKEHLDFTKKWIASEAEIFRLAKPNNPDIHLAAYFILFDQSTHQILLADHKIAGLWLPPGGHVELNEHPIETVKRESAEELSINAEFLFTDPVFLSVNNVGTVNRHTDVSLWYLLKGSAKDLLHYDKNEFHQIGWFNLEKIPLENSDPHMSRFINKLNKLLTLNSYEAFADQYAKNTSSLHPENEGQKFIKMLPKHAKILDIGCGPGRDAAIFEQNGLKVVGIDYAPQMIELAKQRTKQSELYVMDIEKLDFPKDTFEGIWASASFLHIPKKKFPEILKYIHNCLKKDGIFFLSLKKGNMEGLEQDARYENAHKFWSYFEEAEIEKILETAQFKVLEYTTVTKQNSYDTHPFIYLFCKKE